MLDWVDEYLSFYKIGSGDLTNFLLIKFTSKNKYSAENAEKFLASRGILVRGMKVYGLPNHLRVSIGTDYENIKFVEELKTFLEK